MSKSMLAAGGVIYKMSVKYQKKSLPVHSSTRVSGAPLEHDDLLICSPQGIKFKKTNLSTLYLQCACQAPHQPQQSKAHMNMSVGFDTSNGAYAVELDASGSLYMVKNHVKHIFPLEGPDSQSKEWIHISFPASDTVVINTYGAAKSGRKISLVNQKQVSIPEERCYTVRPVELLEEKIKLRAMKMSKSQKKGLNFSQNKSLGIVGSTKSPTNKAMIGLISSYNNLLQSSDIEHHSRIGKTPIPLANCDDRMTFTVKGVEFKKSVEKHKERGSSNNKQGIGANPSRAMVKHLSTSNMIKQEGPKRVQKQNERRSTKYKDITASSKGNSFLRSSKAKVDTNPNCSSSSFYTSKKSVTSIYEECEPTPIKENPGLGMKSLSSLMVNKCVNTEAKKVKVPSKGGFNLSTNPKSFNKNISQSKIMQVSRTLLGDRANK